MSNENFKVDLNNTSLLDDELFREILGRPCGYTFICRFLEDFFELESGSLNGKMKIIPQASLPSDIYRQKSMTGDLIIVIDDTYIDIEVYTSFKKRQFNKSIAYIIRITSYAVGRGEKYTSVKEVVQINIGKNIAEEFKSNGIMEEKFFNVETFYLIDVDNISSMKYNNIRNEDFTKLIRFMNAARAERKKLAKGDDMLMDLNKEIESFINSEEYINNLSRRARDMQIEREEGKDEGLEQGLEQGRNQNQTEIVMNMYDKDFTIEQICSATKLSKDEINTIIHNNKTED